MTYALFVTGCQQNIYDSKKITHLLNKMGYFESEEKDADIIIVFSCSVRQKPMDRIFGKIKVWKKLPKKPKIIVTACVLPTDKIKLKDKVDAILDPRNIEKNIVEWINRNIPKIKNKPSEQSDNLKTTNDDSFVPIMYGCNNFCSYCAVPYTRGREISRSYQEIVKEIKEKTALGIKEITLLGQNVNSFKSTKKPKNKRTNKQDFVKLLEKIESIEGLEKISFLTSHPKDMSDDLIDWMSKSNKFSGELHLPVQSGDDKILIKMNRRYTAKKYLNLVKKIRTKVKLKFFSTDIIVGFPSETKEQFKNTLKLCKIARFDKAFISQYSPRSGTLAANMTDNVPREEKKHRWLLLDKSINKKGKS